MPTRSASKSGSKSAKKVTVRPPTAETDEPSPATSVSTTSTENAQAKPVTRKQVKEFDGLALDWEDSEQIVECFLKGDSETAAYPSEIDYKYDPELEDSIARDTILAKYYMDACSHAVSMGFTSWQVAVWITLFAESLREYLAQINSSQALSAKACIDVFMDRLVFYNYKRFHTPPFVKQDAIQLIDYFMQTYAQHVRLIHHVFTQPQEINIQKVQQHLEESAQGVAGDGRNFSVGIHPLQEGIPAEKWEEWCRAEEERRRLEKEREEREWADAARRREEEQTRAAMAALEVREPEVEEKLVLSLEPLELPRPPAPTSSSLFPEREGDNKPSTEAATTTSEAEPAQNRSITVVDPENANKNKALNPSAIAAILSSTIDQHLSALAAHFDKQMEHQLSEMQSIVERREKDKKEKMANEEEKTGKGSASLDKKGNSRSASPAKDGKGRAPSPGKKGAKSPTSRKVSR